MRHILTVLILVSLMLVGCTPDENLAQTPRPATSTPLPVTATNTSTPTLPPTQVPTSTSIPILFEEINFIFQGEDPGIPIVTNNPSPEINNRFINPGSVFFHEGQFHMFFNSFSTWPDVIKVGYMTSDDGYHWQMVQDAPVFTTDQITFGDGKADVSTVLVMDDGTWVMYFHTIDGGEIGRAAAASPLGPWSVDSDPMLTPSPEGVWDSHKLGWPSVVRDGNGLRMYYGAQTATGFAIGLATSTDGINWTRHGDPVLEAGEAWETQNVDRPRVVKSPDGWVMIYQGGSFVERRGLAISEDGIRWQKYPSNPILTSDVFPIRRAKTWDTSLVYHDGIYYYIMELGTTPVNETHLYLTTYQGALHR